MLGWMDRGGLHGPGSWIGHSRRSVPPSVGRTPYVGGTGRGTASLSPRALRATAFVA